MLLFISEIFIREQIKFDGRIDEACSPNVNLCDNYVRRRNANWLCVANFKSTTKLKLIKKTGTYRQHMYSFYL